jgi:uncharacterized protein YeaO (DUF488 family)
MKKAAPPLDGWLKEVAPGDILRRWFSHDPTKWTEFRRRYFAELDGNRTPGARCWRQLATAGSPCSTALGTVHLTAP